MLAANSPLAGYKINEYKVVLVPHEDLNHKILNVRKYFNEKYKVEQPVASLPEVALVTFKQLQVAEERIINRLKMLAMGCHPIKVEVKDFGSFPSHSIFLNITSKVPLGEVSKKIRQDAQRLMKLDNDNKPHFLTDFYFIIARKLKPWQYENGWLDVSHKSFTAKFIAAKMLLLKRPVGEFRYKAIASFEFENLPVETVQGNLF
jgi:2'-5' RNA ligase